MPHPDDERRRADVTRDGEDPAKDSRAEFTYPLNPGEEKAGSDGADGAPPSAGPLRQRPRRPRKRRGRRESLETESPDR